MNFDSILNVSMFNISVHAPDMSVTKSYWVWELGEDVLPLKLAQKCIFAL